jgi:membrane protein
MLATLYYVAPNVKPPTFRWLSPGVLVAVVLWVLATLGFFAYVSNFGSYNKTYGTLGGLIVLLLWLWITNLALLFGAELDAELERGRQLQAGIPAEETLQLPARDTRNIKKAEATHDKDVQRGKRLRKSRGESQKPTEGSH